MTMLYSCNLFPFPFRKMKRSWERTHLGRQGALQGSKPYLMIWCSKLLAIQTKGYYLCLAALWVAFLRRNGLSIAIASPLAMACIEPFDPNSKWLVSDMFLLDRGSYIHNGPKSVQDQNWMGTCSRIISKKGHRILPILIYFSLTIHRTISKNWMMGHRI
jgi:hypothetical protein